MSEDTRGAILLVSFGAAEARSLAVLDGVAEKVRRSWPLMSLRWAYTSQRMRERRLEQGVTVCSPEEVLVRLGREGCSKVAVLPLQIIPGREFDQLLADIQEVVRQGEAPQRVVAAQPLLASRQDMTRVADVLFHMIPHDREPSDAVIWVGHGTGQHPADALYTTLHQLLQERDASVFLGTLSGHPSLAEIMPRLRQQRARRVHLLPFMTLAGNHVRQDIAGDRPESWKSSLEREGFPCMVSFSTIGESPEIVALWLDHLRDAIAELESVTGEQ